MTTQTISENIFERPPRAIQREGKVPEIESIATTQITCCICDATVTVPILHPGLLCYRCERNPQQALEHATEQWLRAQARVIELDKTEQDETKKVYTRYLNVMQARYESDTRVLGRLLAQARKVPRDPRLFGDSPRIHRLLAAVERIESNAAIVVAEQARVQRAIEKTMALEDELANLLIAEQRYREALAALDAVLNV